MTIETRFNKGETVFFIENNAIVSFPVRGIEYRGGHEVIQKNGTITYSFLTSKAPTSLDKDRIVYKNENECFKSIDELANFYKNGK
jgi:hypothetical protein